MTTEDKPSADSKDVSADKKQKLSLDEAVKIVNQAIREREEKLRRYIESGSEEFVAIEGESRTGYCCGTELYAKDVARVMLDYNEPTYHVLGEDYPEGIWDGVADIAGLESIRYIDL